MKYIYKKNLLTIKFKIIMETKTFIKMLRALSVTMKNSKTYKLYKEFNFTDEHTTEIENLKDTILGEFGDWNYELTRMIEAIETLEKYK